MSDPSPALDQIGNDTPITVANGTAPSAKFIALWNLRLPLFIRRFVGAAITKALAQQAFVNVFRSKADSDHTVAIMVDTQPGQTPDASFTDGLDIKSDGKHQLIQRTMDSALILFKAGDDTMSVELTYDGTNLKIHPVGGMLSLNLDGATSKLKINGVQVLKAQQAAIAQPTGGSVIDIQARAAIDSLLTELGSAMGHGLIT